LINVPTHGDTVYIVKCDLKYPEKLRELHSDYPISPEHLTVSPDMLSDFCSELQDKNWIPSQKLIPNSLDKTKYVCHYRNLQFYIKHGLIVTKIHRIISFDQKPWLKPWIDYCTIEFEISGSGEDYIDFGNSMLYVQAKITQANANNLGAAANTAPVNLFLHSLFSQVQLNGTLITSSTNTYPYRAMLETLLSYGEDAKKTQLSADISSILQRRSRTDGYGSTESGR